MNSTKEEKIKGLVKPDSSDLGHEVVIEVEDISKDFKVGKNEIHALRDINLKIYSTDFAVIFGPSGCGKSTLLNIILGIDNPTTGKVILRDRNIFLIPEDERGIFRSRKIGMIYQTPYWVRSLNSVENVALPLIIEGIKQSFALARAHKVMEELEIDTLAKQIPTQLSGGEQQKLELARALVANPWIIMADEPTGNLDSASANEIMELFDELNQKHDRTVVLVTHNQAYWGLGNRRIEMKDGKIIKDSKHRRNSTI